MALPLPIITRQDGPGAFVVQPIGYPITVTPGNFVTFALLSTVGVQQANMNMTLVNGIPPSVGVYSATMYPPGPFFWTWLVPAGLISFVLNVETTDGFNLSSASYQVLVGGRLSTFIMNQIIHTGQSLSVGNRSNDAGEPTQPYNNVKLLDALGIIGYDITKPLAPTLSLAPLTTPQRSLGTGSQLYPQNIDGETSEVTMANQMTALAKGRGAADFRIAASCTGQGGAAMSVIQKGGSGNAYAAGIYECLAFQNLVKTGAIGSFGVLATILTHGEADGLNNGNNGIIDPSGYLASLVTLQANYQADVIAITGQVPANIPMVMSQCNSVPGPLEGQSTVALAMLQAAQQQPALFIMACPKYQFVYQDAFHLADYRALGEKYGQYMDAYLTGKSYAPLWNTANSRITNVVTMTFNVPVSPLVFDVVNLPPVHQAGMFSMWANGGGFEAWDNPLVVSTVTGNGVSPIAVTFTAPHNLNTNDIYELEGILGNVAANGVWTITKVSATQISLNGSTGNGNYTHGGTGFAPISITSAVISGNNVVITMGRSPTTGLSIGYAMHVDQPWNNTGASPPYSGNLRDSDPFVGLSNVTPHAQFYTNWCVQFVQAVA
jgi:hypothetical protein